MPLPDDLSAAERWTVQGRQGWNLREAIQFGPYEARDVHRSWTRGRDRGTDVAQRTERSQSYSFALFEEGVDTWRVKCESTLDRGTIRTPVVDVDVRNRSNLSCALTASAGSETWLLALGESRDRPLEGRLESAAGTFEVRGTTELQKSLPTPETSGYYITRSGRAVAAVEVVNRGSVTVSSSLGPDTKSLLSATATALLLLEELRAGAET